MATEFKTLRGLGIGLEVIDQKRVRVSYHGLTKQRERDESTTPTVEWDPSV